tara:strand:- start:1118 stop:1804 length:687 start_codon:yes stop_codon:yes gene_type:complete
MNEKGIYWNKISILEKLFLKILKLNREELHQIFLKKINYNNNMSILDIGTANTLNKNHNIILSKTKKNKYLCCLTNQTLSKELIKKYPQIKKVLKGDGRNIKLKNNSFDIVYSSATLEHVGSLKNQIKFVSECYRVSKRFIFITTPNRFYPIDFHTKIPFIHWLPKKIHRNILLILNMKFYSKERNLNLLSVNDIKQILNNSSIAKYKIIKKKFLFFTSNIIIFIEKN